MPEPKYGIEEQYDNSLTAFVQEMERETRANYEFFGEVSREQRTYIAFTLNCLFAKNASALVRVSAPGVYAHNNLLIDFPSQVDIRDKNSNFSVIYSHYEYSTDKLFSFEQSIVSVYFPEREEESFIGQMLMPNFPDLLNEAQALKRKTLAAPHDNHSKGEVRVLEIAQQALERVKTQAPRAFGGGGRVHQCRYSDSAVLLELVRRDEAMRNTVSEHVAWLSAVRDKYHLEKQVLTISEGKEARAFRL